MLWSIKGYIRPIKFGDMVTKGLAWRCDSNVTVWFLHDMMPRF